MHYIDTEAARSAEHRPRHVTPSQMKTSKTGNAHPASKFTRFRREAKRLEKKFGKHSPQRLHFLSSREGWAARVLATQKARTPK